jgi:hypothetical protein
MEDLSNKEEKKMSRFTNELRGELGAYWKAPAAEKKEES